MMAGDGKPKCCYCRQNHSSTSCKTVTCRCYPENSNFEEIRKVFCSVVLVPQNHFSLVLV